MKEFEYDDIPGKENLDTQGQLDTFESLALFGGKDRYIFDFSTPLYFNSNQQYWNNDAWWDKKWDTRLGAPGDIQFYYKGFSNIVNSPTYPNYATVATPSIKNITETWDVAYNSQITKGAPYFNENAALFVGAKPAGIYGQGSSLSNPDAVTTIRSGYYEFTIKTDKNNCIIGYGIHDLNITFPIAIDTKSIFLPDGAGDFIEFKILIENGKLKIEYNNPTGNNKTSFSIIGNKTISDDEWHHIVVNLGKPGVKRTHSKKQNEKFVEFWIDGLLDKRSNENVNGQIFYPTISWLLVDPKSFKSSLDIPWLNKDYDDQGGEVYNVLGAFVTPNIVIGNNEVEFFSSISQGWWRGQDFSNNFRGAINTYVAGYNQCLDKFEIQFRNNLWRGIENPGVQQFTASAKMMEPTITSNKKKALKLFWNNLVNDKSINGIELDNNYQIDTVSITNKIANSVTEVYNVDNSINKKISYLKDVRVAIKDNIFILRPGAVWIHNFADIALNVGVLYQNNMYTANGLNALSFPNYGFTTRDFTQKTSTQLTDASVENISIGGVTLKSGDRILLTNQYNSSENGIYIFNGLDTALTRAEDANSSSKLTNAVVRVIDGYYKDTSWFLSNSISTLNQKQNWLELESHPTSENINSQPLFGSKWSNNDGTPRFIDLEQDINISKYDVIVFMNYPETNEEIKESFVGYDDFEIKIKYDNFIKSLRNVCAQGASLYVSSPKLAEDLGIVKKFTKINQQLETSDGQSAAINPFEINETADRYFDTHRNNKYELAAPIAGLTNKETYILTDFINYNPDNSYDYEQYHAKYAYRQFGLQEGNEFIIPGLSLRKITTNENLPGFVQNQKTIEPLAVVAPSDVLTGTVVTKLANTYYNGSTVVNNPYDDYASTIIVYNGQTLAGQPINGKIFVNCVEDGYTFSRQEYNKAVIQVIPTPDTNETTATRAWQYSTSRLNRLPQRINVRELTELGQTTSTNGGGGPLIQAPSNASNGIIRSNTDSGNINYQSDLYASETEEIYATQQIPVLSMTWLGLQWLAE
jgi:hypothetical protein